MKNIVLLGATGSIGVQTVEVVLSHPEKFSIIGLSAGRNIKQLEDILAKLNVEYVCVTKEEDKVSLINRYPMIHFCHGEEGLIQLATLPKADIVVNALVGFVGLTPTLKAIESKKDIALANKETLVVAGEFVIDACKKNNVKLYPIDSEHSAIFQCLQGNHSKEVKRLILTASGGSFRDKTRDELKNVTKEQALNHPNWSMGAKITIDSATMMNKGLEIIEAHWLFRIDYDKIDVLIHKESVIHSMVEYCDNAVMAQLGTADMKLPIQYALSYPDRLELFNSESLDLLKMNTLHFAKVDMNRFPLVALAYEVGRKKGNLPAIMNAANEAAVDLFLKGDIPFLQIDELVTKAVHTMEYKQVIDLNDIYEYDRLARDFVYQLVKGV